jgi:hypothetical protein
MGRHVGGVSSSTCADRTAQVTGRHHREPQHLLPLLFCRSNSRRRHLTPSKHDGALCLKSTLKCGLLESLLDPAASCRLSSYRQRQARTLTPLSIASLSQFSAAARSSRESRKRPLRRYGDAVPGRGRPLLPPPSHATEAEEAAGRVVRGTVVATSNMSKTTAGALRAGCVP